MKVMASAAAVVAARGIMVWHRRRKAGQRMKELSVAQAACININDGDAASTPRSATDFVSVAPSSTSSASSLPSPASESSSPSTATALSTRLHALLTHNDFPIQMVNHFIRQSHPDEYPPYHPTNAPDGYIPFAIAENKTCLHALQPLLQHRPGMGAREAGYNDFKGMLHVRQAVARMIERLMFGRSVDPTCILMTAGANIALDSLFYCIANPGEYVLLATPYYAAFEWDLRLKSGVLIEPVIGDPKRRFEFDLQRYKATLANARKQGKVVRAVLLCNPANPLGTVMSRSQLEELIRWVKSEPDLHLVSDEIYALSCHSHVDPTTGNRQHSSPFVSLGAMLSAEGMGDRFHIIYALSKDWSLSGFRCGWIYTENRSIHRAFDQLAPFNGLSTDVEHFTYLLFESQTILPNYLWMMQWKMKKVVDDIETILNVANIPFIPSQGGLFMFIDLREFLLPVSDEKDKQLTASSTSASSSSSSSAESVASEIALYNDILSHTNCNLTPGTSFHCPEAGWFRLCHSAVNHQAAIVGVQRIVKYLHGRRGKNNEA